MHFRFLAPGVILKNVVIAYAEGGMLGAKYAVWALNWIALINSEKLSFLYAVNLFAHQRQFSFTPIWNRKHWEQSQMWQKPKVLASEKGQQCKVCSQCKVITCIILAECWLKENRLKNIILTGVRMQPSPSLDLFSFHFLLFLSLPNPLLLFYKYKDSFNHLLSKINISLNYNS